MANSYQALKEKYKILNAEYNNLLGIDRMYRNFITSFFENDNENILFLIRWYIINCNDEEFNKYVKENLKKYD